jgi:hypothetical protein
MNNLAGKLYAPLGSAAVTVWCNNCIKLSMARQGTGISDLYPERDRQTQNVRVDDVDLQLLN